MTALEIVDHRRVWHDPNGYLVGDRYLCEDCSVLLCTNCDVYGHDCEDCAGIA